MGETGDFKGLMLIQLSPHLLRKPGLSLQARRGSRKRPTRLVKRRAGLGTTRVTWRVERVIPERVIPQKRLAAAPIRTCWPTNVIRWGLD